jgi:molybdate transport system substrate-binding protein
MMFRIIGLALLFFVLVNIGIGCNGEESGSITAFCGSASKPAMEEAAAAFEQETGIEVFLNFGGSGTMLSQMKVTRSGDVYIPGSPDYMQIAVSDDVVDPETVAIISYLVPAILVQAGNPENIRQLSDLAREGIEIGIGNPEAVCVGLYAYEILEYNGLLEEIEPNIVTHAESCSKTATLVALKSVDAILGWRVFSEWHDTIDVVYLEPQQIPRLSYIPGAVSRYANDGESARKFLEFLVSPGGQAIFGKWGYIATENAAREYAPGAEIGGEYHLPETYRPLVQ